jgi:SulP family sulfate permease
LLYIYRVAQTTTVAPVTPEYIEEGRVHILQDKTVPSYVSILRIHGPFLFGTTDKLEDATADVNQFATVVILRLRNMTALDGTGLHAMERLADRLRRSGRTLLLCGAREQPAAFLEKAEFVEHVGKDNILPDVSAALDRARQINASFAGLGDEVAADMKDQPL